jgi:phage baseplate assembly protein W
VLRKEFLGRGWSFPFGFDAGSGGVASSEFERNIQESISVILGTRPGERQMLPEFGCRIHELMFSPNTRATATLVAHHVGNALERFEPRIEVTKVDAWPSGAGTIRLMVHYRIRSTLTEQELTLAFSGG